MTVQHTGTGFLTATCDNLGIGYRAQHLYGRPDEQLDHFWVQWVDGTDLPIVTSLRHPQSSMDTFWRRTGPDGVNGYSASEHVRSFVRLRSLIAGEEPGTWPGRTFAIPIDGPPQQRAELMAGLCGHVGVAADTAHWAELWPVLNAAAPRRAKSAPPSDAAPCVPDEIVVALGYSPRRSR